MEEETSMLWKSFLKHVQTNWAQAQANMAQARANEETSRAFHLLTQRMPSKGAMEVLPDRLESWYAAECDAEAGVTIAGKMIKRAEGLLYPGTGQGKRRIPSSVTKAAVGTKKRVPSIFGLLAAGGDKPEMIISNQSACESQ